MLVSIVQVSTPSFWSALLSSRFWAALKSSKTRTVCVARHARNHLSTERKEDDDGQRNREVVQPDEGLWIHSAPGRRQGRVCSYFSGREGRPEHPQRRADCS